jgi:hypothetical protein
VTSTLAEVECLRTLDRLRLRNELTDADLSAARAALMQLFARMELLDLSGTVMRRAASPTPTRLGTLEALHLATALLWREQSDVPPVMATHDAALGMAARAHGMLVIGV